MKKLLLSLVFILTLSIGCRSVVNPNEWVVSTGTCWNTMSVTKSGQMIPRLMTACDRMVILPATELSAEIECDTKFANRVAGKINITYQWRIIDPLLFIKSAKSITSSPTDDDDKISVEALEGIENGVVDKLVLDATRELTPTLAAGVDELTFEKALNIAIQSQITDRGVEFSNMSANIDFDGQTEEALGVISALKFYEANNESELGRRVIEAKAGAPVIIINENP